MVPISQSVSPSEHSSILGLSSALPALARARVSRAPAAGEVGGR
eukprot:COSAG04_NODE_24172_length_326_cov_0.511013_1_plen_43_part_10